MPRLFWKVGMFCNMATQAAIVSMSILDDGKSDSVVESVLNNDRIKITMADYPHYVFMINMNRPRSGGRLRPAA